MYKETHHVCTIQQSQPLTMFNHEVTASCAGGLYNNLHVPDICVH